MTALQLTDRALLKSVLSELMQERQDLFKEILKEILLENQIIVSPEQASRRERLETLIREDFDKYKEVFKAFA